ncbi:MAG: carboxyl-terminal protease [Bacteroidales bacterium]|nr:carboxyl-terminal protease [Bacteroidales bacterium]
MKNRIFNLFLILALGFGSMFINSCEKEIIYPEDRETIDELYSLMNQWYFWKDSIPDINPDDYSSPEDLLEAMRYIPRDKWSYITTQDAHSQYFEEGTYIGYGFGYALDSEGNTRITFLYEDSDFSEKGIERGWIIKKINGTIITENSSLNDLLGSNDIGISNTIELESPTGEIVSDVFVKKLISMNTVGNVSVIEKGSDKIGYFVFKSFIGPSADELTEAFSYFLTEGVNELVIDLRYNGGGQVDVVEHLAGLIIPDHVNGELLSKIIHNSDRSDQDNSIYFEQNSNSLRLDKVYFITSKSSASASELIINSLDPFIDVILVGDDTYGKPVGMYSFASRISNVVYVPIAFKLTNSAGFGEFYDGLQADSYVADDIKSNFGIGEDVFDEVIYHIENGSFSSLKSSTDIYRAPFKEIRNLRDEIGTI